VQIRAAAFGAVPYGTSRTPNKIDRAKQYGLEAGFVERKNSASSKAFAKSSADGSGFNAGARPCGRSLRGR